MARNKNNDPLDRYYTPEWCVDLLISHVLPGVLSPYPKAPQRILDPGAGKGVFIDKLRGRFPEAHITGIDLDPGVGPWDAADESYEADFLLTDWGALYPELKADGGFFDLVTTNPPFSRAVEYVKEARRIAPIVVYLLRQGFLSSARRYPLFVASPPTHVFQLMNRPQFDNSGSGDKADYVWLAWSALHPAEAGTVMRWLPPIRRELRKGAR